MNSIRSTAFSAGILVLTTLGGSTLSACSIQTIVGNGNGGGGGSGSSTSPTCATSGEGGGSHRASRIYNAGSQLFTPWGIAVDAANVYITDNQGLDGKVLRVPLDGTPAIELATGQNRPSAIAVDATDVYFLTGDSVSRVPIAGGPAVVVTPAENSSFSSIVVDAANVYWTDNVKPGSTMFLPKAGGQATTVDTGSDFPSGLVVQGGSMYWGVLGSGEIKTAPIAGGSATVFASGQNVARTGLAADSTYLYWLVENEFPERLVKAPLAGGPPVDVVLAPSQVNVAQSLVSDATHAYFIESGSSSCGLAKVELATGTVERIPVDGNVDCPMFLAVDASSIYYTSQLGVTQVAK